MSSRLDPDQAPYCVRPGLGIKCLQSYQQATLVGNQLRESFSIMSLTFIITKFVAIIVYNINVLQQTACLVVNPITVGNFSFLFNCTPVGRTSASMMVPT